MRKKWLWLGLGLVVLSMGPAFFLGRYAWLGLVQEHRPIGLTVAAARILYGNERALILERDSAGRPRYLIAMAAMERIDGDWPLRKKLAAEGLTMVDQLGSRLMYKDAKGQPVSYHLRMFTRSMMVAELTN